MWGALGFEEDIFNHLNNVAKGGRVMTASDRNLNMLKYTLLVVATFIVLQVVMVVMHEFSHSTVAWMLGYMRSPLDIVWGNPLSLRGWDEGVHYKEFFAPDHHHPAEALIGVSPLIVHAIIVFLGLTVMRKGWMLEKKWLFHVLFWFTLVNFMELFAYITMGSFLPYGDMGHFTRGLDISPWIMYIAGTLAMIPGLYILFWDVLLRMQAVFAKGDRLIEWTSLFLASFLLFVWGSSGRVAYNLYPNPQWMFCFFGFAMFAVVLICCNPSRRPANQE